MPSRALVAIAPSFALCASLGLLACGDDDGPASRAGDGGPAGDGAASSPEAIDVIRDDMGVVHVFSQTDAGAYYGAGYMQAHDRLFQMDLMRRRALGRRAELLGPTFFADDELMRRVDIPRLGRENLAMLRSERPAQAELIDAWTAGVNARIDEVTSGRAPLPYGFGPAELDYQPERWTAEDVLAVGKLIVFGNANQLTFDILATVLRDFVPALADLPLLMPLEETYILGDPAVRETSGGIQPAPKALGDVPIKALPPDAPERLRAFVRSMRELGPGYSNNWVVDGVHTDNGRPLIANDPHQPLKSPSLMWAHHMNSADAGGRLDAVGFGFVGVPSVQLGHNRHISWAATTTYPDMMDIWDVEVTGNQVAVGGALVDIQTRTETIEVAGEEPRVIEAETVPGYGILLPPDIAPLPLVPDGHRLLFNWTGFVPTHEASGFHDFDLAEDLDDFEAAVDSMEIAAFNFLAASADGISYRSSMLVPDHGAPSDERAHYQMLDGSDPATLWTGEMLPLDRLPRSRGGSRGWIVSANNDPFGFTSDGRVSGDELYFGVFFDPGTRASRIEDELGRKIAAGPVTAADMKLLQDDTHSVFADRLIPILEAAHASIGADPGLAEFSGRPDLDDLVARLSAWDREMERDSSEAVVFNAFAFFVTRRALADDFSVTFDAILDANQPYMLKFALLVLDGRVPNADAYLQEGRGVVVLSALAETADYLQARFRSLDPSAFSWGEVHGVRFDHVWEAGESLGFVSTDGAVGTVNVSDTNFLAGGSPAARLDATSGAIFRAVTHFAADGTPVTEVNYPPGNVGGPSHPDFAATLEDWVEHRYQALRFERVDVEAAATEERSLVWTRGERGEASPP